MDLLLPYFLSISTEKNESLRHDKAAKNVKNFISALYLTFSSAVSLYYLNKGNYLPVFMGGFSSSNDISNIFIKYPMSEHAPGIKALFLALSGHYVSGTYRHWKTPVEKQRNDHIEMYLHHLLTLSLFLGSYLMNDIETGLIVSYLMDICDVPIHFAKGLVDTHWRTTCKACGVVMWFLWGWTRLVCLPYHIYYTFLKNPFEAPHNMTGMYQGYNFSAMACLLSILGIMGVWWFYLITKMVFRAIVKDKQEDI